MTDWLFEGRLTVYLALLLIGVVFAALWWRDRKRHWLGLIGGVVAAAVLYFLLDRLVETGREQITRKLYDLAAAVERKDSARIVSHCAATFRLGKLDREGFRRYADDVFRDGWVTSMAVWGMSDGPQEGEVHLKAKPRGSRTTGVEDFLVKTRWTKEGGQWRMVTFTVHHPLIDGGAPLPLPGID